MSRFPSIYAWCAYVTLPPDDIGQIVFSHYPSTGVGQFRQAAKEFLAQLLEAEWKFAYKKETNEELDL